MLDSQFLIVSSSGLAIITHLLLIPREPDFYLWHLGAFYLTILTLLFSSIFVSTSSFLTAVKITVIVSTTFNTVLTVSVLVHRGLIHRLRKFPGPGSARLTRGWFINRIRKGERGFLLVDELHKRYGVFVRTGPRELSINHPTAISLLYSSSTPCIRSPFYGFSGSPENANLLSQRTHSQHRSRLGPWERGLNSPAQLSLYEPQVHSIISTLLTQLRAREVVDWSSYARFVAGDVTGLIGMGQEFKMTEKGEFDEKFTELQGMIGEFAMTVPMPWLVRLLFETPGLVEGNMPKLAAWLRGVYRDGLRRMEEAEREGGKLEKRTLVDWLLVGDKMCGAKKLRERAMVDEIRLIMNAGIDTVGLVISSGMYFLAKHPRVYKKLQKLLDEKFPDRKFSHAKVLSVEYLDAIIMEALRLYPPAILGVPRQTPKEGMTIAGRFIPGEVVVNVPPYTVNRHPDFWSEPDEFIPERWTAEGEHLAKDKSICVPFSMGMYRCPGKAFAMMELRMLFSEVAMNFDVSFADPVQAEGYERGMKDYFTLYAPTLLMKFSPR